MDRRLALSDLRTTRVGRTDPMRRLRCATRFARAYADQTESDHAWLVRAVRRGKLPADTGL